MIISCVSAFGQMAFRTPDTSQAPLIKTAPSHLGVLTVVHSENCGCRELNFREADDQQVTSEVWIVRQNFKYHYEDGYEDEPERLNQNGECFAVIVARKGHKIGRGSEEMSFCDAVTSAESLITGIVWDDHVLGKLFGGRQHRLVP